MSDNLSQSELNLYSSDALIRRLYKITNSFKLGFEYQIQEILLTGLERFNLDIGILSKIDQEKNTYTVEYCVVPEGLELKADDVFELDLTYCSIAYSSDHPVAIENMGEHDAYAYHPAYKAFGLEAYIGIPVLVNDQRYGTLNFSSAHAYPRKFERRDIDALQLMASWLSSEIIRRQQQNELECLNQKLQKLVELDGLTEIYNRRGMRNVFTSFYREDLDGSNCECNIALIDIDHFKHINDTFGHLTGDQVLKNFAQVGVEIFNQSGMFIARFGGEEFIVWMPSVSANQAYTLCEQYREAEKCHNQQLMNVTASIGLYSFMKKAEITEAEWLSEIELGIKKADKALYAAKESGRDKIVKWDLI